MAMKSTPGVNFINILHTNFAPIFWCQKIIKLNRTTEKLLNLLQYKKRVCKMLMKLTLGNLIKVENINVDTILPYR